MSLKSEKLLPTPRGYKGCIRYALIETKSGQWKVEKRRPFGWDAKPITADEAEKCDTRKKAEKLWNYHHMKGTASWWGEQIIHPFYGLDFTREHIKITRQKLDNFSKGNGYVLTRKESILEAGQL